MDSNIIEIKSIAQAYKVLGQGQPVHPLISIVDVSTMKFTEDMVGTKIISDLYSISLKSSNCGFLHGQSHLDFEEGVLLLSAPKQVYQITKESLEVETTGWMISFHPDLIRPFALGSEIDSYNFFSYNSLEALHLAESEREVITDCMNKINEEMNSRIDKHSQKVIVSGLDLLLSYCQRFYDRQFITRSVKDKGIVSSFKKELKSYFNSNRAIEEGLPSVQYFAEKANLSTNYFSDLLRKNSGRSAKDHINDFLVERAKNLLITSNETVSEIAYSLGFNYPHYFSRLFKSKTGMAPNVYRESLN